MADNRQRSANTFLGGMNKDAADAYLKDNQYRHAENLRVSSDKNDQFGSINNVKGNTELITPAELVTSRVYSITKPNMIGGTFGVIIDGIPLTITMLLIHSYKQFFAALADAIEAQFPYIKTAYNRQHLVIYSEDVAHLSFITSGLSLTVDEVVPPLNDLAIIGSGYVRDDVILFSCSKSNPQYGQIWKMNYSTGITPVSHSISLLYNNVLNFSLSNPIRDVVGNYENQDCVKVYFTDNSNYLRSINYADPNVFSVAPECIDLLGDVYLTKPKLNNIRSGSLKCGTIQYAYRLYNKYGGETSLSPLSNMIHIAVGSDFAATDVSYNGNSGTTPAGKAVEMLIPDIDKRYDNILIYSIFYPDGTSEPEINEIVDSIIDGDEFIFVDTGTTILKAVSTDEFDIYGSVLYKCKTMDSKNNLLIIGNTSGETFDVNYDARAYRYALDGGVLLAKVYEDVVSPTPSYNIDTSFQIVGIGGDVPATNDTIVFSDAYKYKKDGIHLGGSGPNVEYEIKAQPIAIGYTTGPAEDPTVTEGSAYEPWSTWMGSDDFVDNKSSFTGYASPFNSGQFRGYMREETYRFGLVFYSKKGLRSTVKWIGDVKMPAITDHTSYPLYVDRNGNNIFDFKTSYRATGIYDGEQYGVTLYLDFNVTIPQDIADQVSGFEIVRVDRDGKQRTVVAQGLAGPTYKEIGTPDLYRITDIYNSVTVGETNHVVTFSSPEVIFDKNIEFKSGDTFAKIAKLTGYNGAPSPTNPIGIRTYHTVAPSASISKKPVIDFKYTAANLSKQTLFAIDSSILQRYVNSQGTYTTLGGSVNIMSVKDVDQFDFANYNLWGNLVNYYRNNIEQYGGNTYDKRTNNLYVTTGAYRKLTSAGIYNIKVFGGDTFIGLFDFQRQIWLLPNEDSSLPTRGEAVLIPVETTINVAVRTDKAFYKTKNYRIQERATSYSGPVSSLSYEQDYDLYQYNPAYSRVPNVHLFVADDAKATPQDAFDCRIRASNRKQNGEFIDSWTKFLQNNYIDIDTNRGEINKIINHKNVIYGFQNNGLGIASVDDRKIVQATDSSNIVLGTGDVLPRYDYISKSAGTAHQFSVVASDTAIYFFDATDRQIKAFMGDDASLSDNFGIKSYTYNEVFGSILTSDNPQIGQGINGFYDDRYNEVVMTFLRGRDAPPFTIVFNEALKSFTGFYSFDAPLYVKHFSSVFSVLRESGSDSLYLHNFGDYNTFYGVEYESKIHLLLNDKYSAIKVFDSLAIECEVTYNNVNMLTEFFSYIRCYNDYQNTDWHELIFNTTPAVGKQANYERRERMYTTQIPRNIVNQLATTNPDIFNPLFLNDVNREFRERMRGKALNLELRFVNPGNRKISSQTINTTYRISAR